MINVSWDDVRDYCAWLGEGYRLPTEAEWEYAARAGTKTRFSFGDQLSADQANLARNIGKTVVVGSYPANPWGLHDMHGNVSEWVSDWYSEYRAKSVTDPEGSSDGTFRVFRGGSWSRGARFARSAYRLRYDPGIRYGDLGFRCAGVQGA